MKTKEVKPLKESLLVAINKVFKANKAEMTKKLKKVVKKSIKKIVKKNNKEISNSIKNN